MKYIQNNKPWSHIRKAETKIFLTMSYLLFMGTITLTNLTYFTTDNETLEAFQVYFMCQSVGIQPDGDCGDPPDVRLKAFHTLTSMAAILLGLSPLVILVLNVNCTCQQKMLQRCKK